MFSFEKFDTLLGSVETRNDFLDFIEELESDLRDDREFSRAKFVDFLDGMDTHASDISSEAQVTWKLLAGILVSSLAFTDVD